MIGELIIIEIKHRFEANKALSHLLGQKYVIPAIAS
jgi:hypothetical protein